MQIAICAVLVTSSMVAVRGLVRALHSNFGFEPRNAMLVGADLHMAGYSGDRVPAMQKRMIDAIAAIPGVESVGLTDALLLNDSEPLECLYRSNDRSAAIECRRQRLHVPHISRIPSRGGHYVACPAGLSHGMTTKIRHALPW